MWRWQWDWFLRKSALCNKQYGGNQHNAIMIKKIHIIMCTCIDIHFSLQFKLIINDFRGRRIRVFLSCDLMVLSKLYGLSGPAGKKKVSIFASWNSQPLKWLCFGCVHIDVADFCN
jgi:hypothetical protein